MQGFVGSINFMQRVHRNVMLGFDFTHLVIDVLISSLTKSSCSAMAANSSLEITYSMHLRSKVGHSTTLDTSFPSVEEQPLFPTIRWKLSLAQLLSLDSSKNIKQTILQEQSIPKGNSQQYYI